MTLAELRREGFDADRARLHTVWTCATRGSLMNCPSPSLPAFARIFIASTPRLTAMLIPSGLWKSSTCAFAW